MGRLKAALYLEVWRYLQSCPGGRTLLTSLNSPTAGPRTIRTTWGDLQANGRMEGIKKKTGLQAVLSERPDLFSFNSNDRGHLLIELTNYAKMCEPMEEVLLTPASPPVPASAAAAAAASAAAAAAAITESLTGMSEAGHAAFSSSHPMMLTNGGDVGPSPEMLAAAAAAASQVAASQVAMAAAAATSVASALLGPESSSRAFDFDGQASQALDVYEPPSKRARHWEERTAATFGMSKYGYYMDIVWTPELAMQKQSQRNKESELLRSLVRAMEMHAGNGVTLSQLGADFKVAQLKKDPQFKNIKMLDILKLHEAIFEVETDLATGGWVVKLQPGAQAAVPGAEQALEDQLRLDMALPDRIDEPRSLKERMQALRIELLHALVRRGNRVPLQELGQEPRVQQRKQGLPQAKKLIEFVKMFPNNFQVTSDETQMIVEAASLDVTDQFMIDQALLRNHQAGFVPKGRGKGYSHQSNISMSSRALPSPSWY